MLDSIEDAGASNAPLERSQLFSLKPIGIGTPYTESLTGYICRLAEAHQISTGILVKYELTHALTRLLKPEVAKKVENDKWPRFEASVNGVSSTAAKWTAAVEMLTLRTDLSLLTMLKWREILSYRFLIAKTRRWCARCFHEDQKRGEPYERLLWNVNAAAVCPKHQRLLQDRCPECNRTNPILSSRSRAGFCSYCQKWLGSEKQASPVVFGFPIAATTFVAHLITVAPTFGSPPKRDRMAKAFKAMKIAHGIVRNDREFAERLGVSLASVRNWSVGKRTIELQTLLPVCIFCQVRAHDFFAKDLSPICPPWACADDLTRIPARKVTKITDHFVSVLEESLITGDPSLSLKKRLEPYGYSSGTARSTYPELAQKIAKQRRDHLKKKRVEREEASVSKMRGLIFKQLPSEEGITLTAFLTNHPEFKSLNYQKCAAIFKKIMNERSERFSPGEEETKQSG